MPDPKLEHSVFRRAEKYFKARPGLDERKRRKFLQSLEQREQSCGPWPPVDTTGVGYPLLRGQGVIDLSRPEDPLSDEVRRAGWEIDDEQQHHDLRRIVCKRLGNDVKQASIIHTEESSSKSESRQQAGAATIPVGPSDKTAYLLGDGLILIPKYFDPAEQLELLRSSLSQYTLLPNPLNLSTHYHLPSREETSLFELYATSSDNLIRSRAETGSALRAASAQQAKGTSASSIGNTGFPPTDPSSKEETDGISQTNPEWKTDEASHKLKSKTADRLITKELRWANLGWVYNWTNKAYDFTPIEPIPFPARLAEQCRDIVRGIPWDEVFDSEEDEEHEQALGFDAWCEDYCPDAGLVNYYQLSDTLMGHVDRAEVDPYRPLISISLGHAAILLVGGPTRDIKPRPILLRSGDVLVMSGKSRAFYHGVPRILENTLPDHLRLRSRPSQTTNGDLQSVGATEAEFADRGIDQQGIDANTDGRSEGEDEEEDYITRACKRYISTARININARQVFPAGLGQSELPTASSARLSSKIIRIVALREPQKAN